MEWNWLQSLLFGFLSGFAEFLPVSAEAHQQLFGCLTGAGNEMLVFRLICHISVMAALLISCRAQLKRLSRERRIAASSQKRRRRQPDKIALMDMRLLRTAAIPMVLSFALYWKTQQLTEKLWVLSLILVINGVILYLPQFFSSGNKESQGMSALDSMMIGLGGALAVVPGISRIGTLISTGQIRGGEKRYITEIALLLCIPALLFLIFFDIYGIYIAETVLSLHLLLYYFLAAVAAFSGALFGIQFVRFLAVKIGFAGFAYYSWGVAMLIFVLYLTI